ncbi:LOW QUALITY PROTEIN: hypothetical protein V1477_006259 [Vespula maculifrons]|uniref:Uncharacterized protein n=1 Tax=Vespula maculifrons TaxID=7453 RepID=A0ABD2CJX2_VESMC
MCYSYGEKNCERKIFFPWFPLIRYNSAPIGPIWTKKIWASDLYAKNMGVGGATSPFQIPWSGSGRCYSSEKKIVKEKCSFPLFSLNRYNSAAIGPIWTKKIWAARRSLSNNPGRVLLPVIVPEKKIVKEKFFFPLFSLNRYNSAPIGPISLSNDPGPVLEGAAVSEKNIVKEKFYPSFHLNRYNSAPIGSIWTKKICAALRELTNDPGSVLLGAIVSEKKIWARRSLSKDPGPVLLGAIDSDKKILKEKCFFPLFPLNCYNSAPIGPICTQKIWADPGTGLEGAVVSEKKIVKKKIFFPMFHLNRYNAAPIGPIWTKKYERRGRDEPFPTTPKRIVKGKCFFPMFLSNRYNSAPIGPIWTKKIWASRALRALSSDPGPVLLGAIVSEGKIVKEKFFFPLCLLNRYNSAPIGPIWTKKIWA